MALRKRFNKRKLVIPVVAAAVLLVSGIVYAAASGTLTFSGSVGRNSNCRLNIEAATNVNPNSTTLYQPNSTVTATVDSATRNTLTFSTDLTYNDPAKNITFQVQNVGNCYQELSSLSIITTPSNGVTVSWPNLNGIQLPPGTSTGTLTVSVQWTSASSATTTETMSATINYSEYIPGP